MRKPQKMSMNSASTLKYPMAEKIARNKQTTAPTSRLIGFGAFFALLLPLREAAGFFAAVELFAAEEEFLLAVVFLAPPEVDAMFKAVLSEYE